MTDSPGHDFKVALEQLHQHDFSALLEHLSQNPELLGQRGDNGESLVQLAAYYHADDVLDWIDCQTPDLDIFEACCLGKSDRVKRLLDEDKSRLSDYSYDGWTPLHLAAFLGHGELVEQLLAAGASCSLDSRNPMENTPLHAALAGKQDQRSIAALIDQGADVNASGAGGVTPLHLAAARGNQEISELLLANGAVNQLSEHGQEPADLARERGHLQLADFLA